MPTINALVFRAGDKGEWWIAQCLEYDVAVQAKTLDDLDYELQRVLVSHVALAFTNKKVPFAGLKPAPQEFWEKHQAARKMERKPMPFRMPDNMPPPYTLPEPQLRVA